MWKVINVSADRTKLPQQRKATRFDPEPSIAGIRLRQGYLMLLEDEQFERLRSTLEAWRVSGMVDFAPADGTEAPRAGICVLAKEEHRIQPGAQIDPFLPTTPAKEGSGTLEHYNPTGPPVVTLPETLPDAPEALATRAGLGTQPPFETAPPPQAGESVKAAVDAVVPDQSWLTNEVGTGDGPGFQKELTKKGKKKLFDT